MTETIKRVKILGVPVDDVDMKRSIEFIDALIKSDKKGQYILAVNPEKVLTLRQDGSLKRMFEGAALLIPDGIGVVLAMRWLYRLSSKRVPGAELMPNICKLSAEKGYKIFIYGANESVNRSAAEKLRQEYPGIQIAGRCHGYVADEDMDQLIQKINRSKANILFVALGSPGQELWIKKHLSELDVNIYQGIGGTLDAITGNVKRAPRLFRKMGLEWLYRLVAEPKRGRRQMKLPVFAMQVFLEKMRVNGE